MVCHLWDDMSDVYPMGDCIVLPAVICLYAVGIQYLPSVWHALNPTAGSTRKDWNHSAKINCITILCNKWLLL